MSITRAFTTRRVKKSIQASETASLPQRRNTTKGSSIGSIRHKISAPVELIHTTNMLSYNAPDLYPRTASSTGSLHRSDDDLFDSPPTAASSPPTSPDVESSPKRSLSPEPNHLSCYFTAPEQPMTSSPAKHVEVSVIPQRATSHTKKSYDGLLRKRSTSRLSEQSQQTLSSKGSVSFSRSSSARTSTSTTATSHSSTPPQQKAKVHSTFFASAPLPLTTSPPQPSHSHRKGFSQAHHPFGPELAQVTEIAEEYGVKEKLNEIDAEGQEIISKGLCKFSADDYLSEIQGLLTAFLADMKPPATAMWI